MTSELKKDLLFNDTNKSIELLCFVEAECIGRHLWMGGVDLVVAINEESNRLAIDGLVRAMVVM